MSNSKQCMICRAMIPLDQYQEHFIKCREQLINRKSQYQKDASGNVVPTPPKKGCGCRNKKPR